MAALFALPLAFTASSSSPAPLAGNVINMANDVGGLVWRGATTSAFIIDLGANGVAYDTIALAGTNLRSTDTVRVQIGTTAAGTGAYDASQAAFVGSALGSTISVVRLPAVRTERYVRIDITATGHPAGFVQIARLVVAKSITTLGIAYSSKQLFNDNSVVSSGPGYTSIDYYDSYNAWQISTGMITDQSWFDEWNPLLRRAGNSRAILFIADTDRPERFQSTTIVGRITTSASGNAEAYNAWRFEATIESLFA